MKKLKLYGWKSETEKPEEGHFVATVYVRGGNVVIEAETPLLEKELHAAIDPAAYQRGFRLAPSPHEPGTFEKASDPGFLEALLIADNLWWAKEYGGWAIHGVLSRIVEE